MDTKGHDGGQQKKYKGEVEKGKVPCAGHRHLSLLGSTATANRSTTATPLEAATRLATNTATTTVGSATRIAKRLLRAETTLLNLDFDAVHRVGVVGNGGLESGRCLEIDESTVLIESANPLRCMYCRGYRLPCHG